MAVPLPTSEMTAMPMLKLRDLIRRALAPWLNEGEGWKEGEDQDSQMYDIVLFDRGAEEPIQTLPYTNEDGSEDFTVNIRDLANQHNQRVRSSASGMSLGLRWKLESTDLSSKLIQTKDRLSLPAHLKKSTTGSSAVKEGLDLSDCFEAFAKEETLRKSEAYYCSSCKEHVQANKKCDLFKLPDILIISLKRFVYDAYRRDKIDTYVDFPLENLDLTPFMLDANGNNGNNLYDLYGISNHYGQYSAVIS